MHRHRHRPLLPRFARVIRPRLTRKATKMMRNSRLTQSAAIAAATLAAVVGCSNADAPNASPATTTDRSVPASSQRHLSDATAAKPVDVTITPEGDTTVRLGGPPIRFRVTLANNGADIAKLGMVVSLGHCSCGPPGASMMAKGSMRMLDPQTNEWVQVPYVREGTGMDYITENLVPPFPLEPRSDRRLSTRNGGRRRTGHDRHQWRNLDRCDTDRPRRSHGRRPVSAAARITPSPSRRSRERYQRERAHLHIIPRCVVVQTRTLAGRS